MTLQASYQVKIKTKAGALSAVLTDESLLAMQIMHVVNGPSTHEISVDATDSDLCDLFVVDGQIEVWRRPADVAWYLEYEGFHRVGKWVEDVDGKRTFTSSGVGYQDLLARRGIVAYAGSAGVVKSGKAETILKAFVNENAGAGASTGRPITGLTIEADGAHGNTISITCPYRNLLEVCQDICKTGGGDFDVIGTGAAAWQFRWYTGQRGTDRRSTITFSTAYGNMGSPELTRRPASANAVLVIGQGIESARVWVWRPVTLPTSIDRREVIRDARDTPTLAVLNSRGDAELDDDKALDKLKFSVIQTPAYQYGVHYFLGDLVTARYRDLTLDVKLVKLTLTMGAPDVIEPEFENV